MTKHKIPRRMRKQRKVRQALNIGVSWFTKEEWMKLDDDINEKHDTYDEWLEGCNKAFADLCETGNHIRKVFINVEDYQYWRSTHQLPDSSASRTNYVSTLLQDRDKSRVIISLDTVTTAYDDIAQGIDAMEREVECTRPDFELLYMYLDKFTQDLNPDVGDALFHSVGAVSLAYYRTFKTSKYIALQLINDKMMQVPKPYNKDYEDAHRTYTANMPQPYLRKFLLEFEAALIQDESIDLKPIDLAMGELVLLGAIASLDEAYNGFPIPKEYDTYITNIANVSDST